MNSLARRLVVLTAAPPLLGAAIAGGVADTASAAAPRPAWARHSGTVSQSHTAKLTLNLPGAATCLVSEQRQGTAPKPLLKIHSAGAPIRMSWVVDRNAAPTTWAIRARCIPQGAKTPLPIATTTLHVSGRRSGGRGLVANGTLRSDLAPVGPPTNSVGRGGNGVFGQAKGQCVWWADQMRPDIWIAAVRAGVATQGRASPDPDDMVWDAWRWLDNAKRAGLPTGTRPVAGSIVVFARAAQRVWGHVAYVESVNGDGSFVVTEYNSRVPLGFDRARRVMLPGTAFIYGGPAGNPNAPAATPPLTVAPVVTQSWSPLPPYSAHRR